MKEVLSAAGVLVLIGVFLYGATPLFPANNPRFLQWYLAGAGIGMFGFLSTLRLVQISKVAFLEECALAGAPDLVISSVSNNPVDPSWKRIARAAYSALFLAVWLDGVAAFYYFGRTFRSGSSIATSPQIAPLTDHGQTVFVTSAQKALVDNLQTIIFVGIPSILVAGLLIHFLVGVKLFPTMPTLEEWRERKKK